MSVVAPSRRKFGNQDSVTMKDQDDIKISQLLKKDRNPAEITMDIYPTSSDNGVLTFQRWIRKYSSGLGPFGDNEAVIKLVDLQTPRVDSIYETHVKDCPVCQRSLQRLVKFERRTKRLSKISLAIGGLYLLFSSSLSRAIPGSGILAAAAASTANRSIVSYSSLFVSITLRWFSQWANRIQKLVKEANNQYNNPMYLWK